MMLLLLLCLLTSIILLPIYLIVVFVFYFIRLIVRWVLKFEFGNRLLVLDSADTYWSVGENHRNQSYILIILRDQIEGDLSEEIKRIINEKLIKQSELYAKTLCSLHTCFGYPYFLKEEFRAEDFLTTIDANNSPYATLSDVVYDLSTKKLPLNGKVLWEIIIIKASTEWKLKSGLKDHQTPLILRENHTITDGLSLMNLIANSFGDKVLDLSEYLKNIPSTPKRNVLIRFLQYIFMFVLVPGHLIIGYMERKINSSTWKGPQIIHKQHVAYKTDENSHLVDKIKLLKTQIGNTSFTEILLTSISASLNKHFSKNTNASPQSVFLLVVATKNLKPMTSNGTPILRNQFGMAAFEFPVKIHSNSMLRRLETIKRTTRTILKSPLLMVDSFILFNLMGLFPTWVIKRLFPMAETVGLSNLPGFPKIRICGGREVEDVYFFLPQRDKNGIAFSVLTYDDRLHVGLTADEASIPRREHCEEIVKDFFKNLEDLRIELHQREIEARRELVQID